MARPKSKATAELRSVSMTFFCTPTLQDKIKALAAKNERTVSQTIARLLEAHVED